MKKLLALLIAVICICSFTSVVALADPVGTGVASELPETEQSSTANQERRILTVSTPGDNAAATTPGTDAAGTPASGTATPGSGATPPAGTGPAAAQPSPGAGTGPATGTGTAAGTGTATGNANSANGNTNSSGGTGDNNSFAFPTTTNDLLNLPVVTTSDIATKIDTKGQQIIYLIQVIGRYVCIASFVVGAIMLIIGCIGNKKLIVAGLISLGVAGLCFAAITCAPAIVNAIARWAIE